MYHDLSLTTMVLQFRYARLPCRRYSNTFSHNDFLSSMLSLQKSLYVYKYSSIFQFLRILKNFLFVFETEKSAKIRAWARSPTLPKVMISVDFDVAFNIIIQNYYEEPPVLFVHSHPKFHQGPPLDRQNEDCYVGIIM